jgi:ribosome assembly protein 4
VCYFKEAKNAALARYKAALNGKTEKLVTGSDDFTMFMWDPTVQSKHVARLTGNIPVRMVIENSC